MFGRRRSRPAHVAAPPAPRHQADPVNGFTILDKVSALPISTWHYDTEPAHVRHLGPMTQDFRAAFGLGQDDTTTPIVDASGVALVSIQAPHKLIEELNDEVIVTGVIVSRCGCVLTPPACHVHPRSKQRFG